MLSSTPLPSRTTKVLLPLHLRAVLDLVQQECLSPSKWVTARLVKCMMEVSVTRNAEKVSTESGLFCEKPRSYGRGAGHTSENRCLTSNDRGASTNGCEKYGSLRYPVCDPSYYAFGCCVCSPRCQRGFRDTGIGCTKPTYGRGVGIIPSLLSTTTILIIVVVCIVLLVIIVFVTSSRGSGRRNSEQYYPYPQQYYPST